MAHPLAAVEPLKARPRRPDPQVVAGARDQVAQPRQDGEAVLSRARLLRGRRARLLRRGQDAR